MGAKRSGTQKRSMAELRSDRDSLWHILFEQSRDGIVVLDLEGNVFETNQQFADMLGYSSDDIRNMKVWEWDAFLTREQILEKLWQIDGSGHQFETRQIRKDGVIIDVELSNSATIFEGHKLIFCICRDITQRKKLEDEIYQYATTDTLTGLFNRRTFEQRLNDEIALAKRYGSALSLVMYDFDKFKKINDSFGHVEGDKVLVQSARLVRDNLRASDIAVRWGGEEFMVLVPQTSLANAITLAEKLRGVIATHHFSPEFSITASFGVTEFIPQDDRDQLLKRVDDALYLAKDRGRNRVEALAG